LERSTGTLVLLLLCRSNMPYWYTDWRSSTNSWCRVSTLWYHSLIVLSTSTTSESRPLTFQANRQSPATTLACTSTACYTSKSSTPTRYPTMWRIIEMLWPILHRQLWDLKLVNLAWILFSSREKIWTRGLLRPLSKSQRSGASTPSVTRSRTSKHHQRSKKQWTDKLIVRERREQISSFLREKWLPGIILLMRIGRLKSL